MLAFCSDPVCLSDSYFRYLSLGIYGVLFSRALMALNKQDICLDISAHISTHNAFYFIAQWGHELQETNLHFLGGFNKIVVKSIPEELHT